MIASSRPRLSSSPFIANEFTAMIGRRLQIGICLDLARGIVAMEHGKMDFHNNEAGPLRYGFGHASLTAGAPR